MKVLWFEVTTPSRYKKTGLVVGGWQDALESIVRSCQEIELSVAFESHDEAFPVTIEGINYYPIRVELLDKEKTDPHIWEIKAEKLKPRIKNVVDSVCPDIIHVFGTEWPFGLVAEIADVPVVVHIQGSIVFYNNAWYPPGYGLIDEICLNWKHPRRIRNALRGLKQTKSREVVEKEVWNCVQNYMGRTRWDKAMSAVMHPNRFYFHVDEALRGSFIDANKHWELEGKDSLRIISTGCSTFWKGPDLLIKTAKILTELGIDFTWVVAGFMPNRLRQLVEWKERVSFERCHVQLIGFIEPENLSQILIDSTIYVHTAYVENSPNSICEAQMLGVPVISTNVGGISSLIQDGINGTLVPANDPWQMAYEIISLSNDKDRMVKYSCNSRATAEKRHNSARIKEQLLSCYCQLLKQKKRTNA